MDGIDVSGHWSTFIEDHVLSPTTTRRWKKRSAALPGGEFIHRCWQCGSCTNSCTVNAVNPEFNPRYWIYLIRLGMEAELLRDKDIIWQCVSCNKCTYACPREVFRRKGVMKATAHWLELQGPHPEIALDVCSTRSSADQVFQTGKIEETSRTIRRLLQARPASR